VATKVWCWGPTRRCKIQVDWGLLGGCASYPLLLSQHLLMFFPAPRVHSPLRLKTPSPDFTVVLWKLYISSLSVLWYYFLTTYPVRFMGETLAEGLGGLVFCNCEQNFFRPTQGKVLENTCMAEKIIKISGQLPKFGQNFLLVATQSLPYICRHLRWNVIYYKLKKDSALTTGLVYWFDIHSHETVQWQLRRSKTGYQGSTW